VLYLRGLIADKVMPVFVIQNNITNLVGQMASSDTPWALCEGCKASLLKAGMSFQFDSMRRLSPNGHALCRVNDSMQYLILDDQGILESLQAAHCAITEICNC